MKLRRFGAWLKKHKSSIFWGFGVAIPLVGLFLYVLGSTIGISVINRTALIDVATIDTSVEFFESKLSGIWSDAETISRPVTAVMIENSPEARPQSGLGSAEVVFEAIAEGGITRFVAFFHIEQPEIIGPVRSVRPHYIDWILSFDAAVAHAGGSAQGLQEVRNFGVKDLDQFANGDYYYRSSQRLSPHNLYTSSAQLDNLIEAKNFDKESDFDGWQFEDGVTADVINASSVSATISSGLFDISYKYSATKNQYLRSEGGEIHKDANTNKQIAVDNVIIMEVPYTTDSGGYYHYDLVGSGTAKLFRNGRVSNIEWSRSSRTASFKFLKSNKPIALNRGHTWITAIRPGNTVTVKAVE